MRVTDKTILTAA